jgi:UDP-N-acetylglucosamine 2-epimerase (non-hydrolysing)
MMRLFELRADADLGVMTERQTLPELMARIVPAAADALRAARPDFCLVHGDTSTTFAVALAAFYEGVPVGHVEAGLRSFDLAQPFPEEANRRLTDVLTGLDLAPTPRARANLLREGKSPDGVVVTGNTAVDAIRWVVERHAASARPGAPRRVAITLHRRENLPAMAELARALADAARAHPEREFVWPLHPNPAVREAVRPALGAAANLRAVEPLPYAEMAELLAGSELIVTDSGGLQEEGAALGVPVLVVRNLTERPEGVEAGVVRLVGNDPARVGAAVARALADPAELAAMRERPNPYGDGRAGARVAAAVAWRLGLGPRPEDWRPRGAAASTGGVGDAG